MTQVMVELKLLEIRHVEWKSFRFGIDLQFPFKHFQIEVANVR
jgi:hypothetical protein